MWRILSNPNISRKWKASFCYGEDEEEIKRMFEESDRVEHEIRIKVLEVSQEIMQNEAPDDEAQRNVPLGIHATETGSLHTLMYPKVTNLQVITKEGKRMAVKRDDLPILDFHPPITDPRVLDISLPHYEAATIQVVANLFSTVCKVTINGEIMCAKLTRESTHDSISDEINKLYEIQTSNFPSVVRVPRLMGLVESHTGIVGFLMAYIPTYRHDLEYNLRCAKATLGADDRHRDGTPLPATIISNARREKWSRQIEETLAALHSQNIIWGDAKTANVLIDEVTDDAWVVDFGGGNTKGWIDRELHGSVEGDQQALRRIKKELAEDWSLGEDGHSFGFMVEN
ncbi:hypothetical protein V501_07915 [Pseudogymnoascus sp. VKM F-4519 (FW-2642)]|nr:hypothetical protein V501_07915 [Pseudogymnoascus sp. VKM F-4519 (FW-2642)]